MLNQLVILCLTEVSIGCGEEKGVPRMIRRLAFGLSRTNLSFMHHEPELEARMFICGV